MEPLTFEDYLRDPERVRALVLARAHRERAEVVHRLIVEPIKSLFTSGDHHASGPDLAACRKG